MAPQNQAPVTGTATVTVACKILHGFWAQLQEPTKIKLNVNGIVTEATQNYKVGKRFFFNGPGHPQNMAPGQPIVHGFGLTHGIPKDFWDKWIEQHRTLDAVANGLIFAHEGRNKTADEAREKKAIVTGLERLNPNKLPAEFNRVRMAEEQKAKPKLDEEAA